MTTVNNIVDILRIIREQPEWADALRSALLSKELLELPQRLAEFAETTNRRLGALESDMAVVKGDVAELKEGQSRLENSVLRLEDTVSRLEGTVSQQGGTVSRLEGSVSRLESGFSRMEGEFGNMRGEFYELKVGNNIASIASQHLNLRRVRVLKGSRAANDMSYLDLLFAAQDKGDITVRERSDASNIDIVVQGRRVSDQANLYVVFEVSRTAADSDINRAADRSEILRKATGEESLPAVVSAHIDAGRERLANERKVTLVNFGD